MEKDSGKSGMNHKDECHELLLCIVSSLSVLSSSSLV